MQRSIWLALFAALCAFQISCAIKVPRVPICTELGPTRAYCVNTITSEEFEWNGTRLLNGKSYWESRPSLLLLPASSWAEIKIFIIEICKKTQDCDSQIGNWQRTLNTIDSQVKMKR